MKLPEPLLQEFKQEVQTVYGPRFRQLILYGSYARGEAQHGSDVDVLLVLEDVSDPLAERERLSELICRLALKYDVVLSVIPVDEHALMTLRKPLFLNAKREGIAV